RKLSTLTHTITLYPYTTLFRSRQILIDYARKKYADKRGGKEINLTYIDEIFEDQKNKAKELIDIDDALKRLEKLSERLSKVVEIDRKSTRLNSSHVSISYAVFC